MMLLLRFGASTNSVDKGDSPLNEAIQKGKPRLVEELLKAGANVNAVSNPYTNCNSPLQLAAWLQDREIMQLLLKYGANVNGALTHLESGTTLCRSRWMNFLTPIETGCIRDDMASVSMLVAAGAGINVCHWMAAGVDFCHNRCCPMAMMTCIQAAAHNKNLDLMRYLLGIGADPNAVGNPFTALQLASMRGDIRLVACLLENGAKVNQKPCSKGGRTALQAAAECGSLEIVQALLKVGADVNATASKSDGRTALQAAIHSGHLTIAKRLLDAGADANAPPCLENGSTALQWAVKKGHLEATRLLIRAGANVNAQLSTHEASTTLQIAVQAGDLTTVRMLLEAGADSKDSTSTIAGKTNLQMAVEKDDLEMASLLLREGADVNMPGNWRSGHTCLQLAARKLQSDMVQLLLQAGADPNGLPASYNGNTALQCCLLAIIETKHSWRINHRSGTYVNDPANVKFNRVDRQGGIYEKEQWMKFDSIMRSLVASGAAVNAAASIDSRISTAALAIRVQHPVCFEYLVKHGLDLRSRSTILEAIIARDEELLTHLIRIGVDVNEQGACFFLPTATVGITPLAVAAAIDDVNILNQLFAAGARYRWTGQSSVNPLRFSIINKSIAACRLLLKRGALPDEIFHRIGSRSQETPLTYMLETLGRARGNDANVAYMIIQELLDAGADLNFTHLGQKHTPLQCATAYCDLSIVEKLIRAGADVDYPGAYSHYERTALQIAAQKGYKDKFSLLRSHGAWVNVRPSSRKGVTALQAAAIRGHFDIVVMLLEAGADVAAPGAEYSGRHALEGAAEHGRLDIVVLLMNNDNSPDTFRRRCDQAAKRADKQGHNVIAKLIRKRAAAHVCEAAARELDVLSEGGSESGEFSDVDGQGLMMSDDESSQDDESEEEYESDAESRIDELP